MESIIRQATEKDLPALVTLINSAYRGEAAKKGWTHEADLIEGTKRTEVGELRQMLADTNTTIIIYESDGILAGCVYLQQRGQVLYLGMLSVSPEAQAGGIGKKLLRASEDHARRVGCTSIEMNVISIRNELIAWYERNGYHRTDRMEPFYNDERFGVPRQPIQFVIMAKNLQ